MSSKLYKAEGIVIKRKNIGEADRLITLFTKEYGKSKTIAKGIRKITSRRAGHLEVFSQVKVTLFKGKTFNTITEVSPLSFYTFPRENLMKVSFGYYLCELTDLLLPEEQEQSDVYELLENTLVSLSSDKDEKACDITVSQFALSLLRILGFLPEHQSIPNDRIHSFVESITERKLKTPKFIEKTS